MVVNKMLKAGKPAFESGDKKALKESERQHKHAIRLATSAHGGGILRDFFDDATEHQNSSPRETHTSFLNKLNTFSGGLRHQKAALQTRLPPP